MTLKPSWIRHVNTGIESGAKLSQAIYEAGSQHEFDYALVRSARAIIAFPDSSAEEKAMADTTVTGSNDATVFQAAADNGGMTVMLSGTGHIGANVTLPSDYTLKGQGASTVLELDADVNMFSPAANATVRITLQDFRVEGNDRNYYVFSGDQGNSLTEDPRHRFKWLHIRCCNGIYLQGNLGAHKLDHLEILGGGQDKAIKLYAPDCWVTNSEIGHLYGMTYRPPTGIYMDGKGWILGCTLFSCETGVHLHNPGNVVANCVFDDSTLQAMYLESIDLTRITGNYFQGSSDYSHGTLPDILFYGTCTKNIVMGNNFFGNSKPAYNIQESTDCDYNVYIGNTYSGAVTAPTLLYGSNNVDEHNMVI